MCEHTVSKTFPEPAKSAEELLESKKKVEQDKLDELKRQHEYMGFVTNNMR